MNFGYNFGVPRSEQSQNHEEAAAGGAESQNSDYSTIDFSKIPPPTFRFGQFGQVSTESVEADNVNAITSVAGDNNSGPSNGDDDSFLAEPSMSAGQFDASFNFQTQPTPDQVFSPSNSVDSLKSSSVKTSSTVSAPVLVEELLAEPVYLEEPTPHSVEELMKATVDGDTTALMPEFWENIGDQSTNTSEEPAHSIKELLRTEGGMETTSESWENIGEEEIRAAEAEFLKMEESVKSKVETGAEELEEREKLFAEVSEKIEENLEPAAGEAVGEEPIAAVKPEKKTKPKAEPKAKAAPKTPAVSKAKVPAAKKEKIVEEPVIVSEGRAKRERKTVERLADSVIKPAKTVTEKVPAIPSGTGMKLGDIEAINHVLGRKTSADKVVVMLHKVLFNRVGESAHRKASIRSFCGDESSNYETKLKKYTIAELKELAQFLGLTGASEKAALAAKISTFLIKPNLESVKFTAKGERIIKKVKKTIKPKPERSSKRINPDADKKPLGRPPKGSKTSTKAEYLTPETVDSDVESEVEREVLGELKK